MAHVGLDREEAMQHIVLRNKSGGARQIKSLSAEPEALTGNESVINCKSVDFPAPDGPKTTVMQPSGKHKSMSCRICLPLEAVTDSMVANVSTIFTVCCLVVAIRRSVIKRRRSNCTHGSSC